MATECHMRRGCAGGVVQYSMSLIGYSALLVSPVLDEYSTPTLTFKLQRNGLTEDIPRNNAHSSDSYGRS